MKLSLRQKLRSSHVKRWHIVNVNKQQSVAEHSFNVCLISEHILDILGVDENMTTKVIKYALHHDIPEVVLGDVPTSVKKILKYDDSDINDRIQKLSINMDFDSIISDSIMKNIVKLADLVDSIVFLAAHGIGRHAICVRNDIIKDTYNI